MSHGTKMVLSLAAVAIAFSAFAVPGLISLAMSVVAVAIMAVVWFLPTKKL
jgi:hypothetical protein